MRPMNRTYAVPVTQEKHLYGPDGTGTVFIRSHAAAQEQHVCGLSDTETAFMRHIAAQRFFFNLKSS